MSPIRRKNLGCCAAALLLAASVIWGCSQEGASDSPQVAQDKSATFWWPWPPTPPPPEDTDTGPDTSEPTDTESGEAVDAALCDYVVYSEESSDIRDSIITHNGHIGSGGYVEIGVTTQINGNVQSSGSVFLRDRCDINGDVLAGGTITKQNLVEIEGDEVPFTDVPTVIIPDRTVTPGIQDVNIWNGESRVLEPGNYDEVHAYGGTTLTLKAGEYNLRNLIIEASSVHLRLDVTDGHIDLNVQDQLRFGNQMTLEMVGGTDPKLFCVYSNGSWVDVGTDIDFKGTITAPYGEIHVFSRFILHGRLFGKRVYVDTNSQLYGDGCDGICCVPGGPTPTDEVCDGVDEDCDGKTDEEYQEYGTECGIGACAAVGNMICVDGEEQDTCTAGEPAADDSVCNAIDDDCDAETDEDYLPNCQETQVATCQDGQVVLDECNNYNVCDGEEDCEQATCVPGVPLVIDDDNPCTEDSCDPTGGVAHTPLEDGTECGEDMICEDGVCEEAGNRPPVIISEPVTDATVRTVVNTELVDLNSWEVITYPDWFQSGPSWVVSEDNTSVEQRINADASILLSDFVMTNDVVQGTWLVNTGSDDDFMGFVFGYQDPGHYYLFDWKQTTQSWNPGGLAEQGMSVKIVSTDEELIGGDFWGTAGSPDKIETIYHNDIRYLDYTDYVFTLIFHPAIFTIIVEQEGEEVAEKWGQALPIALLTNSC